MARYRLSFVASRLPALPSAAMSITLIIYSLYNGGLAFLVLFSPLFGLLGAIAVNLIALLFILSWLALPLYIVVAGPTLVLSLQSSGIFSRLYIGNLLFVLVMGVWLVRRVLPERESGRRIKLEPRLVVLHICLIFIGFFSIVYSRLFPDPTVTYAFAHSNVSINLVNLAEMSLLIGLPMFTIIVPNMVRTVREAQWMIGAYIGIGILYALGTVFAGPLNLYSPYVILGVRRPMVFGAVSSDLGLLLVLFACIALGQALYASKPIMRLCWGILALLFAIGVIMSFGRESWIGLFISICTIASFRLKNWSVLLMLLLLAPVFLLFSNVTDFFNPAKVYGYDRVNIWQDAVAIWLRSPYMGVGAGNYQFFDLTYGTEIVGVAHNQFLAVLAEMGVQGLSCLLLIIFTVGHLALKRFKTAVTPMAKGLALAYLAYYAALLFASFFTGPFLASTAAGGGTASFVDLSYPWLFFGLVLSIPNWDKEVSARSAEHQKGFLRNGSIAARYLLSLPAVSQQNGSTTPGGRSLLSRFSNRRRF
jgi:O-antigen ligase